MRIDQILADMQYGDAITDNALAIKQALLSLGYESEIYAENIHPDLQREVRLVKEYKTGDCVLHHFAIGSYVNDIVRDLKCKKVLIYHNITPPEFFSGYNLKSETMCRDARYQLNCLKDVYDCALAVSEFNKKELDDLGYRNTAVLPILYNFEKAERFEHKSKGTNILFLGRIAPNKRQQDVIKAFYEYKNTYNKDASLFIAGSYSGMEKYLSELIHLTKALELEDVYFTGRLTYEQMYKLYSNCDLFLSMSEHEGFCVPLIECMFFDLPVMAYKAGAIPETMGNSGVLFSEKDFRKVAFMMNEIIENPKLAELIKEKQRERLKDFSYSGIFENLKRVLSQIGCGEV